MFENPPSASSPFDLHSPQNDPYSTCCRSEMAKETVWRIGPTMRNIYNSLNQRLGVVLQSQDLYLDDDFLLSINIHKEDLNLDDTDDYFHCMTEEAFVNLQPTDLTDPFTTYEDIEHPCSDPPTNVFELEHCARGIDGWFWDLQRAKVSEDGNGMWPAGPDFWIPRPLQKYENIGNLSKYWPAVPWDLSRAMSNTSNKPHQIYSSWHGHEGKDGVILRNELEILFKTMKGKMTDAAFCTHIVPVSSFHYMPIYGTTNIVLGTAALNSRRQSSHYDRSHQ